MLSSKAWKYALSKILNQKENIASYLTLSISLGGSLLLRQCEEIHITKAKWKKTEIKQ